MSELFYIHLMWSATVLVCFVSLMATISKKSVTVDKGATHVGVR